MKNKIFIAGHNGMVGSSVFRLFKKRFNNSKIYTANKNKLNLLNQNQVYKFIKKNKFKSIIICAARAGGIYANNTRKADFIYENLEIQNNLINAAFLFKVKKLIFLGSSCIYPKICPQPMKEEYLLTGPLEETNKPYSIAKIAGISLCNSYREQYNCDFRCIMQKNLYGVRDKFDEKDSHVIPALIKKFHNAKIKKKKHVSVWGSGNIYRDFLYVDDLSEAILKIFKLNKKKYKEITKNISHINVGSGKEITIKKLAYKVKSIVNYNGKIIFDKSMPDGMKKKLLDISRINKLGWSPAVSLNEGLYKTYEYYKKILKLNTH
jgi:GDP-L-fucose synthase